jgi:gamma-glutamylcysteine synthetase
LADRFLADFPESVTRPRTVGRELELPLVTATGQAADVRRLWDLLLAYGDLKPKSDIGNLNLIVEAAGRDGSYAIEVGVGTMEINTRPCRSLLEVKAIAEQMAARLVRAAAAYGWVALGYGVQPMSAPALGLMTPKQRYQSLYRAMGAEWLWYTVTAADQVHVAISRAEAIPLLNFANLMAPVIIALCANSPVYANALSPYCSGREAQHVLIHANEFRHGMPVRPFRDALDFVTRVAQATYLIHRESRGEGGAHAAPAVIPAAFPFTQYLRDHGPDYDAFLYHEHYVWNSARARASYGTIEVRPACQQPWREHMAAAAFSVGLIEAHAPIQAYVEEALGVDYWDEMRVFHRQTIRNGLAAPQPAPGFLEEIVRLAAEGLRARGLVEEPLMEPIFERLARRENPAQRARRIYRTDGMAGLLAATAIRPRMVNT